MKQSIRLFLLSALFAYACGDNGDGGVNPDAGETQQPDAGTDSPDAGETQSPDAGTEDTATALSLGASGNVGVVSTVGIPSLEVAPNVKEGVADSDAVVRRIDDEFYILNRALQNLTILDSELQVVDQFFLGGGANPHDVAVSGDTIYVSGYGTAGILVLDRADPSAGIETIDLSAFEPDTEEPNCSGLYLHGDTLLAACQRLGADFSPVGEGRVAMIDTNDHSFESFDLARENPFSRFVATPEDGPLGGELLIASAGSLNPEEFDISNGCIERIDLDAEPPSAECFLEHDTIGGYATRMEIEQGTLWMAASRADFTSFVTSYDLEAEELGEPLTAEEQSAPDFAICPEGEIVVADKTAGEAQGLRVFADGAELTEDVLDTGAEPAFFHGLVCY